MGKTLIAFFLLIGGRSAFAVTPVFDLDIFYFNDAFAYSSSTSTYHRMFWDFMAGMPVAGKGRWVLGWNYDSMSFTDNPGTAETLSITDMGPKLVYYADKDRTWVIGAMYGLISTGSYNPGTTASQLRGSSMRIEAGYTPHMTDSLLMGAKLVWYKASFKEEVTNETSLAKVTDGRTVIYPVFAMTYRFD
jgi:hypothetical protein